MTAVLCDGGAAAAKAIEFAANDGLLMEHNKDQLILIHVFADAVSTGMAPPPSTAGHAHNPSGTWSSTGGAPAAAAAAAAALTPAAMPGVVATNPGPAVVATLETLQKHKQVATLNYKIETSRATHTPTPVVAEDSAAARPSVASSPVHHRHAAPVAAVAANDDDDDASVADSVAAAATAAAVVAREVVAKAAVRYAVSRLDHHRLRALAVGASNGQQAKTTPIGSVAEAVIAEHRRGFAPDGTPTAKRPVFVIKHGGPSQRPNAAVRVAIVATLATPVDVTLAGVIAALNLKVERGDRVSVGVTANNGREIAALDDGGGDADSVEPGAPPVSGGLGAPSAAPARSEFGGAAAAAVEKAQREAEEMAKARADPAVAFAVARWRAAVEASGLVDPPPPEQIAETAVTGTQMAASPAAPPVPTLPVASPIVLPELTGSAATACGGPIPCVDVSAKHVVGFFTQAKFDFLAVPPEQAAVAASADNNGSELPPPIESVPEAAAFDLSFIRGALQANKPHLLLL